MGDKRFTNKRTASLMKALLEKKNVVTSKKDEAERYLRLYELEDKIENGTLIELPCKVGDTVFAVGSEIVEEATISNILILQNGIVYYETKNFGFDNRAIGNSVFLTKSEAEAKLKELKLREENK